MDSIPALGLLFLLGLASGFINVMAGGGSTLTLPALIFLGFDSALANGTNRVGVFVQSLVGVASFRRQNVHEFGASLKLAMFTLPGAIAGGWAAVTIADALFQRLLALVLIGITLTLLLPRGSRPGAAGPPAARRRWALYLSLVGIGFYGGFLQVGVGFLLMAALRHLHGLDLIRVNMHKVFIVLVFTLPTLLIFIASGNVRWGPSLVLAAGNALGAWTSAIVAVRRGERAIRAVLVIVLVIMALRLLALP